MTYNNVPPQIFFLVSGVLLLYLFFNQLNTPLLSKYKFESGQLKKIAFAESHSPHKRKTLLLWINDSVNGPYEVMSSMAQKKIIRNVSFIKKHGTTIWYDYKQEVKQLNSNNTILVKYNWFLWPSIIFWTFGFSLHVGIYLAVKNESVNIQSYWDMCLYALGRKDFIVNKNYKKFKLSDYQPNTIFYKPIYISKKTRKTQQQKLITSWRQFFNICGAFALKPGVREWMSQEKYGKAFLEGFEFYKNLISNQEPSYKLAQTTDTIFEFISLRLDAGREHYQNFGEVFRQKFPKEYFKMLEQLDKLR